MKSKVKFLPIAIALTLLTSMFVFSAVSAEPGTVALDKSFITTPGGALTVTLTDPDLNSGVLQSAEASGRDAVLYSFPIGVPGPTSDTEFKVKKVPILDNTGDGVVNADDVTIATLLPLLGTETLVVNQVDENDGIITIRSTGTQIGAAQGFTVTYLAPDVQTHTVRVASTQDATGFDVQVVETGSNTGVFTGTFGTGLESVTTLDISAGVTEASLNIDLNGDGDLLDTRTTTTEALIGVDMDGDGAIEAVAETTVIAINLFANGTTRPDIAAVTGALITLTYDDSGTSRVANATVETTLPSISILSPSNDTATRTQSTRLIAEVTDADSGVDETQVAFVIVSAIPDAGGDLQTDANGANDITTIAKVVTAIAGGFRVEAQLDNVPTGTHTIGWHLSGIDKAGNTSLSDQDAATVGQQDHTIRIDTDPPGLAVTNAAETGDHLDADGAEVTAAASADPTSIRVRFNESIDSSSVAASDFRVDGATPADIAWSASHPESVFLKVPTLASNARPKVEVVSTVSDRAGNQVPGGLTVTAALDSISPTITVSMSSALAKDSITIDVQSDESLLTAPIVNVNGLGVNAELTASSLIGTNLFRSTFTGAATPQAYNVQVTANDTTNNQRVVGTANGDDDGAIVFELDSAIPAPDLDFPGGDDPANVFTQNPFITFNWGAEGTEYGLFAAGGAPVNDGSQTVDLDSNNMVTLTSVTLDGVDVSGGVLRVDDGKFLLAARDLTLAEHELKFTGQDNAGNSLEVTQLFTVKERPPFALALSPGWNLVSIPGEPKTPAINDLIPSDHKISIVLTYNPSQAGGWLTATRGDDGLFSGTLTEIGAGSAYWVFTESFDALNVPLKFIGAGEASLLPTVNLVAGWNMVPVLDVTATKVFDGIVGTPGVYIGGGVVRAYEFDIFNDRYAALGAVIDGPDAGEVAGDGVGEGNMRVGRGFWVYMGAAATLVP